MKTIEEQIRIFHSNNPADLGCEYSMGVHAGYEKGLRAGVEFAQQWYSVEDELPPINMPVFVKYKLHTKSAIEYDALRRIKSKDTAKGWQWSHINFMFYFSKTVTHWRPIEYK